MPEFSIVIPAFNAAKTLPQTLDSIRRQTVTDWQAWIVDDGSTDQTAEIAQRAQQADPRFKACVNTGKGPSDARNYGALTLATGTFIAFCDADDLWLPNKLENVATALATTHADAMFGQIGFFQNSPTELSTVSTVPTGPVTIPMLLGENPVCTTSNLTIRRSVLQSLKGFDPQVIHNEDLELLIRLVGHGFTLQGVNQRHVLYRTNVGGLSSDLRAMEMGRQRAVATAARFGFAPNAAAEAVHLRYLARRALRLNVEPKLALRLTHQGLSLDAHAFLSPPRRGLATAAAALLAPLLPTALRRALFAQ
ncbi:glycosyl transferase family protein [Actibacterium atlanticum]|uniref:Glycosyl transferase family protein n=1 Tax=Actibacterium atlanticum TaxID=1461693 RepID=A0A058ZPZ8_9RHOB|nr:glycosyltransferase family 2 protein [Actibacterium atlanticum]KCV83305.1 glycosyl transferase family protein [Actibacterium atlanticum]